RALLTYVGDRTRRGPDPSLSRKSAQRVGSTSVTEMTRCSGSVTVSAESGSIPSTRPPPTEAGTRRRAVERPWASTTETVTAVPERAASCRRATAASPVRAAPDPLLAGVRRRAGRGGPPVAPARLPGRRRGARGRAGAARPGARARAGRGRRGAGGGGGAGPGRGGGGGRGLSCHAVSEGRGFTGYI